MDWGNISDGPEAGFEMLIYPELNKYFILTVKVHSSFKPILPKRAIQLFLFINIYFYLHLQHISSFCHILLLTDNTNIFIPEQSRGCDVKKASVKV